MHTQNLQGIYACGIILEVRSRCETKRGGYAMRHTMIPIILALAFASTPASADELRGLQAKLFAGIGIVSDARDKQCPRESTDEAKEACRAAFNFTVATARSQIANLEVRIKARLVQDSAKKKALLQLVPAAAYNQENANLVTLTNEVNRIFSGQQQQSLK